MKKLFDETYESETHISRTIWYGYYEGELVGELKDQMICLIKNDIANDPEPNPIKTTSWVFYDKNQQKDAISYSPRASFMVRYRNDKFVANFNMSDYQFVVMFDAIEDFKNSVVSELNNV